MSNSTVVEWLNENALRAYPLTSSSTRYFLKGINTYDLYPIVLDALLVYSSLPSVVEISQIKTTSTDVTITVTGTSFVITNYTSAIYPKYLRDSNKNLLVIGDAIKTLPINTTFKLANAIFEPSVALEILPSTLGLSSLTIGTDTLTGDIDIDEGYQVSLTPGQTIDIEVGRNQGVVLPCGDILGGDSSSCDSIISSVNGVTPNKTGDTIKFVGSNHVNIYDDPDNNRIYIGYDFVLPDVSTQKLPNPSPII